MNHVLIAVVLIVLHNVDGEEVSVNPDKVTTLHRTHEVTQGRPNTLVAKGIKCVIGLDNGKTVSVVEDCGMVRQAIKEAQR